MGRSVLIIRERLRWRGAADDVCAQEDLSSDLGPLA